VSPLETFAGPQITHQRCRNEIPKNERLLLFVQFPDLMKKVSEALAANGISFLEIRGTATQKSKNLEKFQDASGKERVLLLNVMDESASGAYVALSRPLLLSP
jgi:SNF2 family DNA or RNA helicase